MTPIRLKNKCAIAVRLAEVLATNDTRFAVIVVPMFCPSTIAAAISNEIHPLKHITGVNAMVALDDWIIIVNIVPITRKKCMEKYP